MFITSFRLNLENYHVLVLTLLCVYICYKGVIHKVICFI